MHAAMSGHDVSASGTKAISFAASGLSTPAMN
jgi:hypothetical protein